MYSQLYLISGDAFIRLEKKTETSDWQVSQRWSEAPIQSLAVDPAERTHIFLGTRGRGVFVSEDAGETFAPCAPLPEPPETLHDELNHPGMPEQDQGVQRVFSLYVAPPGNGPHHGALYAGMEPSRLLRSDDGGASWRELSGLLELPSRPSWSFPPRPWTSHVRWLAAAPDQPRHIYAGIELGGVMHSPDGGRTWEDRKPGAYKDCHQLATHPQAPGRVYEAAGGGVAWCQDYGKNWAPLDDGLTRRYVWALAVDAVDPDLWFVAAAPGAGNAHHSPGNASALIFRRQGSQPWEPLTDHGLPAPSPEMWTALAAHPNQSGVFAAVRRDGALYLSRDAGEGWQAQSLQQGLDGGTIALAFGAAKAMKGA